MKGKGKLLFAVGVLALAVLVLVFLFDWLDTDTVPVRLPETTASLPSDIGGSGEGLLLAAVTPETVQAVAATLTRPDGYSRRLTVESFWDGGSATWQVDVWQKGSVTRIRLEDQAGRVKQFLRTGDAVQLWYGDDAAHVFLYPFGSAVLMDTLQMLPTYEDILVLEPERIIAAGYVEQKEGWRIMVAAQPEGDYLTVYYLSIETGLLEACERWDGQTLIYRMQAEKADLAAPADSQFTVD